LRAVRDWTLDSGFTPQLLVDAGFEGVQVPASHIQDGRIILNIHPDALGFFDLTSDRLRMSARFDGQKQDLEIPYPAIQAIYARETGKGLVFQDAEMDQPPEPPKSKRKKSPTLKVVK